MICMTQIETYCVFSTICFQQQTKIDGKKMRTLLASKWGFQTGSLYLSVHQYDSQKTRKKSLQSSIPMQSETRMSHNLDYYKIAS